MHIVSQQSFELDQCVVFIEPVKRLAADYKIPQIVLKR